MHNDYDALLTFFVLNDVGVLPQNEQAVIAVLIPAYTYIAY